MSSENSRVAERALLLFRYECVQSLVNYQDKQQQTSSLSLIIKALVMPELPWNPTVRKMTYHVLKDLYDYDPEAFAEACRTPSSNYSLQQKQQQQQEEEQEKASDTTNDKTAHSKLPNFSLKAGMGNWRPPSSLQTNHGGIKRQRMPPPRAHAPKSQMPTSRRSNQPPLTITGVAPWASSSSNQQRPSNPPLTVTGVAPWANKSRSKPVNPPLTITGVAPWANQKTSSNKKSNNGTSNDNVVNNATPATTTNTSAGASYLDHVLNYMKQLKPPPERQGASSWAQEQMAETPTLLPSLKFHDLVFGHELGSGAFGHIKYARKIELDVI